MNELKSHKGCFTVCMYAKCFICAREHFDIWNLMLFSIYFFFFYVHCCSSMPSMYTGILMFRFLPLALNDKWLVSLCTVPSRPQRGDRDLPCECRPTLSAEVPLCSYSHQRDLEQREGAQPEPAHRSGSQGRFIVVSTCAEVSWWILHLWEKVQKLLYYLVGLTASDPDCIQSSKRLCEIQRGVSNILSTAFISMRLG